MNKNFELYNKTPSNFCVLPFIHKAIDSNGDFKPCCVANPHLTETGNVANINDIPFDDFLKSSVIQNFKQSFKNNERNSLCDVCWKVDDVNGESHRKRAIHFLVSQPNTQDSEVISLQNTFMDFFQDKISWNIVQDKLDKLEFPYDLEIEPGTTCNFKCHFCGPYASSSWQQDHMLLYNSSKKEVEGFTKLGHWALDSEMWNSQAMYNGKKFHFMGGEPMLINSHFDFLEKISKRKQAKDVIVAYNTNGSKLPPNFDLYKKFNTTLVAFSIDAIEEKFEYQRYPGKWKEVENNIKTWITSMPTKLAVKIDPGWSVLNLLYMAELFIWADDIKKQFKLTDSQFDFDGHYYFGPFYCPTTLRPEQKELFKLKMETDIKLLLSSDLDSQMLTRADITYKNMIKHMFSRDAWTQEIENSRTFRIKGLDKLRNQSLKNSQPELNTILKIYE